MKLLNFVIAGVLLLSVSACTNTANLITKNWKVSEVHFTPNANGFPPEQQKVIERQLMTSFHFYFLADSTYLVVKNAGDTTRGRWWLNADKKSLMNVVSGDTTRTDIITLNKETFTFQPQSSAATISEIVCVPAKGK
jgi:hypothetical protein